MSGADFSENMSWQNNVFAFMLDVQTSFFSLRYFKYICEVCYLCCSALDNCAGCSLSRDFNMCAISRVQRFKTSWLFDSAAQAQQFSLVTKRKNNANKSTCFDRLPIQRQNKPISKIASQSIKCCHCSCDSFKNSLYLTGRLGVNLMMIKQMRRRLANPEIKCKKRAQSPNK